MTSPSGRESGFWARLVENSLILSVMDRFTKWLYRLLRDGFFGFLFTSYPTDWKTGLLRPGRPGTHPYEFRYGVCRRIETSAVLYWFRRLIRLLFSMRLRVWGVFLLSFGCYSEMVVIVRALAAGQTSSLLSDSLLPVTLIFASFPLLSSIRPFREAVTRAAVGRFILSALGFGEEDIPDGDDTEGRMGIAFLIGMIFGLLTAVVQPMTLLLAAAGAVSALLILVKPEIGVLALFVLAPWLPTMLLAGIVIWTFLSWGLKLFRGKRTFRFEAADIAVIGFMVLTLFGGLVSLSSSSLKPALLLICLTGGYFLCVGLLRSREWLVRCSTGAVLSAVCQSLWAVALYVTGGGYASKAWLDSEMFSGIAGRAVGTLDNPNVLGEYLILILPIAAAMLVGRGEGLRRLPAFLCCCIMGGCLILTWSRGAWLALIIAALLFLLMWHHRSLWFIFAGIGLLPVLPAVLPASVISRFTSIGNLADSSTSYRVNIWRASINMIRDNLFTGIGIGEGAWKSIYPMYTISGIAEAPHSHNLFLQIWLETGIVGLIIFLAFLFLLLQACFGLFAKLSRRSELKQPDISVSGLRENAEEKSTETLMRRGIATLRLSVIGPVCGLFAVLAQGMTDYAWYNYRLFLLFWMVAGLAMAYIRSGREKIGSPGGYIQSGEDRYDTELPVADKKHRVRADKKEKET